MSSTEFKFGYELNSKQVRVYQPHDVGSVRRAISANLQEYLVHEGIHEEDPTSLKNLFLKVLTLCVAAGVYVLSKSRVSGQLLATAFVLFATLIGFQVACSMLQRNDSVIFVGTGQLLEDQTRVQKSCFRKLKRQRVCVRLTQDNLAVPVVRLEVQIIGPSRLFAPPPVYSRVEKSVQYGQFFGSTGFFFPPPLIGLIDGMLESVSVRKQK